MGDMMEEQFNTKAAVARKVDVRSTVIAMLLSAVGGYAFAMQGIATADKTPAATPVVQAVKATPEVGRQGE